MFRVRLMFASGLLLVAAPLSTAPSHASPSPAIACTPLAADVCATYAFVCQRLQYHGIDPSFCHLA